MDETLIPVDYQKAGHIVDDEVHDVLVRGLPAGVRLTGIMDCCHSESILDLPYVYTVNGDLQIMETSKNEGIVTLVSAGTRFLLDGNKKRAVSSITQVSKCLLRVWFRYYTIIEHTPNSFIYCANIQGYETANVW